MMPLVSLKTGSQSQNNATILTRVITIKRLVDCSINYVRGVTYVVCESRLPKIGVVEGGGEEYVVDHFQFGG